MLVVCLPPLIVVAHVCVVNMNNLLPELLAYVYEDRMIDKCQTRIIALLKRPGMNKLILADRAGVHPNTLKNMTERGWSPKAVTLEKIMAAVEKFERL